jgi:glycosyltransferase involved in cell wall biosynthesis
MKLGYFAPAPDAASGVADYARQLAQALTRNGVESNLSISPRQRNLYQLGNNRLHAEMYRLALQQPDTILLHDATLNHFLLGQLSEEQYQAELTHNYGANVPNLWQKRSAAATDEEFFHFGLLKRVCELQKQIVVHSVAAKNAVLRHQPHAKVHVVPHLHLGVQTATPPKPESEPFRFGCFGFLRPSKRVHVILRAFQQISDRCDARLVLAGSAADSEFAASLEPLLHSEKIERLPHQPESMLDQTLASVDLCLNLRYPSAGETSGIAIRAAAVATPVLLSEAPEQIGLPPFALQVSPGISEQATLTELMLWAVNHRQQLRQLGEAARQHLLLHHDPDLVAQQIISLFR